MSVAVGSKAPEFTLTNQDREPVTLSQLVQWPARAIPGPRGRPGPTARNATSPTAMPAISPIVRADWTEGWGTGPETRSMGRCMVPPPESGPPSGPLGTTLASESEKDQKGMKRLETADRHGDGRG